MEYFVPITWAEIEKLGQKGIGPVGIRAYMVIKFRAYGNKTSSFASQDQIRKELVGSDGSLPTIRGLQKAIDKLVEIGMIRVKVRGSSVGTNEYTITSKLVPEPQFVTRNHSTNASSAETSNQSSSETLNQSSSKEEELNLIYYNKKSNIEYIRVNGKDREPVELFNSIVDEPNSFYMSHSDDDIEHIKSIIQTIENPDELVATVVKRLISMRNW